MYKTITIYFINHQIFSLNLSLFKFSDENFPLDWNSQNEPKTAAFYFQKWVLQLRTHQWIQSTSYVCTGRIFHKLLRTLNKVLLENFLQRNIALIFTLLLVHSESKLVFFSTYCQCLKTFRKSMFYIAFEAIWTKKSNSH